MRQNAQESSRKKKVKKESLSDWRIDLNDLIEIVDGFTSRQKEVEKKGKE